MIIAAGFEEHIIAKGYPFANRYHNSQWDIYAWAPTTRFYFKILKGKYSGTIGYLNVYYGLAVSSDVSVPLLTPKSMEFLPDYDGPRKLVVKAASTQYDKSGLHEIANGDVIMYTTSGTSNIIFGKVMDFDAVHRKFRVATKDGIVAVRSKHMVMMDSFDLKEEVDKITVAMLSI